ncbi:hypothetical protein [Bacteroides propionicifaciens]|jgi:hypothetical protein|uniref:hypothetical protein n=1 Tax=Bacteroides propionicifaciens TaxID=392838 RepID=UPI0003667140|nr:hypothetical protein [Bacteroides propionicifaciens]
MDIHEVMMGGLVFKGAREPRPEDDKKVKVKTKAKKATYITGQHGSASSKMKAEIRRKKAARKSQRTSKKSK